MKKSITEAEVKEILTNSTERVLSGKEVTEIARAAKDDQDLAKKTVTRRLKSLKENGEIENKDFIAMKVWWAVEEDETGEAEQGDGTDDTETDSERQIDYKTVHESGYKRGYVQGQKDSTQDVIQTGEEIDDEEIDEESYNEGYGDGYDDGFEAGVTAGYMNRAAEDADGASTEVTETTTGRTNHKISEDDRDDEATQN